MALLSDRSQKQIPPGLQMLEVIKPCESLTHARLCLSQVLTLLSENCVRLQLT